MSVVVGIIEGNKIYMGADSAGTAPETLDQVSCVTRKIYKEGEMLIGTVGSFRGIQLVQNYLDIEGRGELVPEATSYEIVSGIVEDMRKIFIDYGYTKIVDGRENGGHFLIGYRGMLFLVQPEYDITIPAYPYYAIGNGDTAAFGVLYATQEMAMSPEYRLKVCLEAAEQFNAAVRAPWVIDSVGG